VRRHGNRPSSVRPGGVQPLLGSRGLGTSGSDGCGRSCRRCAGAQASQRATWPPKRRCRQRSIPKDLKLARLTWRYGTHAKRHTVAGRCPPPRPKGRDNGRGSARHLQQNIERARHLADRADGDAVVKARRSRFLCRAEHGGDDRISVFCSKRWVAKDVPQGVNTDPTPRCDAGRAAPANEPMEAGANSCAAR